MNCSCYAGDAWFTQHVLILTTYRYITSTVTHYMEFTEECLTVFLTNVHALLCVIFGYLAPGTRSQDHVDLIYNVYIFKVTFNQESWQYVP